MDDSKPRIPRLEQRLLSLEGNVKDHEAAIGLLMNMDTDSSLRAENERLRAAMRKADRLAKTAFGHMIDAQPLEIDEDILAALDTLGLVRAALFLPIPEPTATPTREENDHG